MLWKGIACSLIIVATQGIGFSYTHNITCDIYHLEQQKQMLSYMAGEIKYLHKPLIEICYGMSCLVQEPYQSFLQKLTDEMEQGNSMKEVWSVILQTYDKKNCYPKTAMTYFSQFPDLFIYDGNDTQLASLHRFMERLDEELAGLKKKKSEQGRVMYLLSSLFGVFLIILFL